MGKKVEFSAKAEAKTETPDVELVVERGQASRGTLQIALLEAEGGRAMLQVTLLGDERTGSWRFPPKVVKVGDALSVEGVRWTLAEEPG